MKTRHFLLKPVSALGAVGRAFKIPAPTNSLQPDGRTTNSGNGHLVRPNAKKNDFGGTFGGPVVIPKIYDGHDKTFFFVNVESYLDRKVISGQFITVPTPAMRNGDFSSILTGRQLNTDPLGRPIMENAIYDPATSGR